MEEKVTVTDEEAEDLVSQDKKIFHMQHRMGLIREEYLVMENQLMGEIVAAKSHLNETVNKLAAAHGISQEDGNRWRYVPASKAFVKM